MSKEFDYFFDGNYDEDYRMVAEEVWEYIFETHVNPLKRNLAKAEEQLGNMYDALGEYLRNRET